MNGPRKSLTPTELKRLHRSWRRRTDGRLALVLDGVQNPFNLGSIARTAAAFRVDDAWLVGIPQGLSGSKVQKTAMGSDRFVNWHEASSTAEALEDAQKDGYRLIGLELGTGGRPLFELDLHGDICLVVGHEERGLSSTALAQCEGLGFVPLLGKVGSLNVAMASGLALYEVRRQEWTALPADD